MRIYLAARYSRRLELCVYRVQLQIAGHECTSRWLNGSHQISDSGTPIGNKGEALVEGDDGSRSEQSAKMRQRFVIEDFQDVITSELLIAFTEPPRSNSSRGGRHVELGIALGRMMPVWVIGHRENIFCWMDNVRFFETWDEALPLLERIP